MAITVISTNTIGAGLQFLPALAGDELFVLPNVTLMSTTSAVASIVLTNITMVIDGTLVGATRAVTYELGANGGNIVIGATGTVRALQFPSSDAGIVMFGDRSSLTNHGEIAAPEAIAVYFSGIDSDILNTGRISGTTGVQISDGGSGSALVNHGSITGSNAYDGSIDPFEGRGVFVESADIHVLNGATGSIGSTADAGSGLLARGNAGGLVFENFGQVWATGGSGVDLSIVNLGSGLIRVSNHGTITGREGSYLGSRNADGLVNRGTMVGDVDMGEGDDTFDTRGGTLDGDWFGGLGNDFYLGSQSTLVHGEIFGGADADTLHGGDNDDTLFGGTGDDSLRGRAGDDFLFGDEGDDLAYGGAGEDSVYGGSNEDLLYGGADDDGLFGDGSADTLYGGAGNDTLDGGGSSDKVYGGAGDDTLDGGTNNDTVSGGAGDDVLLGNTGNDWLYGGWGRDTMTGGAGDDSFVFNTRPEDVADEITDFTVADDTIRLDDAAFAGLTAGALAAAAFVANASGLATTAAHRVIYETDTGRLYFDEDGTGAAARVLFATLDAGLAMTSADVFVY